MTTRAGADVKTGRAATAELGGLKPESDLDPEARHAALSLNVGEVERWASALFGGAIALYGLSRRSLGGLGLAAAGGALVFRGVSGHCALYDALGINTGHPVGARAKVPAAFDGVRVEKSITIDRPIEELYLFWRSLDNLPLFMSHLESVETTGEKTSRWIAKGPLGAHVEWDAEIIKELPNETLGWRSLPGADVESAGSVHFRQAPGGHGTEVKVALKYLPPGGKIGAAVAQLLGESPDIQIEEDLDRFRQMMETGAVPTPVGEAANKRPSAEGTGDSTSSST